MGLIFKSLRTLENLEIWGVLGKIARNGPFCGQIRKYAKINMNMGMMGLELAAVHPDQSKSEYPPIRVTSVTNRFTYDILAFKSVEVRVTDVTNWRNASL